MSLRTLEMWLGNIYKKIREIFSILYIGIILWIAIFSRTPGYEQIFKGLFWEVEMGYCSDIILNILLFVLLGIIIWGSRVAIIGIILSLCIEFAQYIFILGYCEVDDVLNNSIGIVSGAC